MPRKTKASKTSKSSKASKTTVTATPVVVATPVVTVTPVVVATPPVATNTVVVAPTEPTLADDFGALLTHLSGFRSQITALTARVRALRSRSEREIKAANKAGRKRRAGNRKPSGFVKPALISDELATFLGKPSGTEMARTEVTREITQYIRAHKLQDPSNGRIIRADTKLRKLLGLTKSIELTYFNLQKYMSPLFPKTTTTTATATATTTTA